MQANPSVTHADRCWIDACKHSEVSLVSAIKCIYSAALDIEEYLANDCTVLLK